MVDGLKLISPDDGTLLHEENGWLVSECGNRYPIINGIPDLRPKNTVKGTIKYIIDEHENFRAYPYQKTLEPIIRNKRQVSIKNKSFKSSIIEPFIPEPKPNAYCLDHGCGRGEFRSILEAYGYNYVGVDNEIGVTAVQGGGNQFKGGATHLCDLHRLPFGDDSFQFAVSYSVFEHLQMPFVAAKELFRVLQPGGICFVAVASIIPFHVDSFFHFTHFGVLKLFSSVGFEVKQIAPADWNAFLAIAQMDGLPGPKLVRNITSKGIYFLHRLLWYVRSKVKKRDVASEELRRRLIMSGIIKAILEKPF